MKKLICLILAVMMAAAGTACFAETAEESVTFVRILENTTADVYENPEDTGAADTLEGGTLCVLVSETVTAEEAWYNVFYLNSRKEGATGYINAENAEKLSPDQLDQLMKDPDQVNKLIDLVQALSVYKEDTDKDKKTGRSGGTTVFGIAIDELYGKAMDELENLFSKDMSGELDKITDATKEVTDKLSEEGENLPPEVKNALEGLTEGVTDTVDSVQDGTMKANLDNLLNDVSGFMDDLQKNSEDKYAEIEKDIQEKLELLNSSLGKDTGDVMDQINDLVSSARDLLDNGNVQNGLNAIGEKLGEAGLTEDVNSVLTFIELFSNKQ